MLWLDKNFDSGFKQVFIVIDEHNLTNTPDFKLNHSILIKVKLPLFKNITSNIYLIRNYFKDADKIIMHSNTLLLFLFLFKKVLSKTAWIIYGSEDMYILPTNELSFSEKLLQNIKIRVLSKVGYHITHIKGDSEWCNDFYGSNAQFINSPVYLSNTVETINFYQTDITQKKPLTILVGNSTDPSNNHEEIFNWLVPYKNEINVFCPLSYGQYLEYKNKIKKLGDELFGNQFFPIENFMSITEYQDFLNSVDIVIFNHKHQAAMGVSLTAMCLGKIIYLCEETNSFKMLKEKGFEVFSNKLLMQKNELFKNRNIANNKTLLEQNYSEAYLKTSWQHIYSI